MRGHDGAKVSQAEGKGNQLAFFKDKLNTRKHYCFFQLFVMFMYVQFNEKGKIMRGIEKTFTSPLKDIQH